MTGKFKKAVGKSQLKRLSIMDPLGMAFAYDKLKSEKEELLKTIKDIADHAARETDRLKEYKGDTYSFILKLCKKHLEENG